MNEVLFLLNVISLVLISKLHGFSVNTEISTATSTNATESVILFFLVVGRM